MPIFDYFVQVSDAPPQVVHVSMVPNQHTPMKSMGSMEVFPLNNLTHH